METTLRQGSWAFLSPEGLVVPGLRIVTRVYKNPDEYPILFRFYYLSSEKANGVYRTKSESNGKSLSLFG